MKDIEASLTKVYKHLNATLESTAAATAEELYPRDDVRYTLTVCQDEASAAAVLLICRDADLIQRMCSRQTAITDLVSDLVAAARESGENPAERISRFIEARRVTATQRVEGIRAWLFAGPLARNERAVSLVISCCARISIGWEQYLQSIDRTFCKQGGDQQRKGTARFPN